MSETSGRVLLLPIKYFYYDNHSCIFIMVILPHSNSTMIFITLIYKKNDCNYLFTNLLKL